MSTSRIKRPNSNSASLGQFYRRREKMIHESARYVWNGGHDMPPVKVVTGGTYKARRNAAKRAHRDIHV